MWLARCCEFITSALLEGCFHLFDKGIEVCDLISEIVHTFSDTIKCDVIKVQCATHRAVFAADKKRVLLVPVSSAPATACAVLCEDLQYLSLWRGRAHSACSTHLRVMFFVRYIEERSPCGNTESKPEAKWLVVLLIGTSFGSYSAGNTPCGKIGQGCATEGRSNLLTVLAKPEVVRRTV